MAKTETLAGRTTPDTKARLRRMLAALDRRESYIVEKAVERMLDEWEAEQAELGEITVRRDEAEEEPRSSSHTVTRWRHGSRPKIERYILGSAGRFAACQHSRIHRNSRGI